jgi:hypothetical protein
VLLHTILLQPEQANEIPNIARINDIRIQYPFLISHAAADTGYKKLSIWTKTEMDKFHQPQLLDKSTLNHHKSYKASFFQKITESIRNWQRGLELSKQESQVTTQAFHQSLQNNSSWKKNDSTGSDTLVHFN